MDRFKRVHHHRHLKYVSKGRLVSPDSSVSGTISDAKAKLREVGVGQVILPKKALTKLGIHATAVSSMNRASSSNIIEHTSSQDISTMRLVHQQQQRQKSFRQIYPSAMEDIIITDRLVVGHNDNNDHHRPHYRQMEEFDSTTTSITDVLFRNTADSKVLPQHRVMMKSVTIPNETFLSRLKSLQHVKRKVHPIMSEVEEEDTTAEGQQYQDTVKHRLYEDQQYKVPECKDNTATQRINRCTEPLQSSTIVIVKYDNTDDEVVDRNNSDVNVSNENVSDDLIGNSSTKKTLFLQQLQQQEHEYNESREVDMSAFLDAMYEHEEMSNYPHDVSSYDIETGFASFLLHQQSDDHLLPILSRQSSAYSNRHYNFNNTSSTSHSSKCFFPSPLQSSFTATSSMNHSSSSFHHSNPSNIDLNDENYHE